jgi:hypothetical protein
MIGSEWKKSSFSGAGNDCVETRLAGSRVEMRDSLDPGGTVLSFSTDSWRAFLAAEMQGERASTERVGEGGAQ